MCIRFAEGVRRFGDNKILSAVPIQRHLLEDQSISEKELLEEIHLLGEDGTVLRGAEAIKRVVQLAPSLESMRWMLDTRIGQKSVGIVYRVANKLRRSCIKCRRKRY